MVIIWCFSLVRARMERSCHACRATALAVVQLVGIALTS
jgi:hypothetical protein